MGFSGDLKDIDLSNIFQTLGMNQHEGILRVTDPERKAEIYFGKRGIRLLVNDRKPYTLLGELLLRQRLVKEIDLHRALKIQRETGKRLGEVLVEEDIISEADLGKALREQMEEKIYEIFSWEEARFQFNAGEAPPDDPFFSDGKAEVDYLTFNINSIMMEAARRIDHWALINQTIPSRSEILRLTRPAKEVCEEKFDVRPADVELIVGLINGHRPINRVIRESGLGNFKACTILKELIDKGHADFIPSEEMIRLGNSYLGGGHVEEGVDVWRTVCAREDGNEELRLRFAEAALDQGLTKVAAEEYRAVGYINEERGDQRRALASYTTAAELDENDLLSHERLYTLYRELGERDLAREEGRILAKIYTERKRFAEGEEILLVLKDENVLDVAVTKQLIKIYLERKEKGKAISELEALGHTCEIKGRFGEAEEAYEMILRLDKNRNDIRAKLSAISKKAVRAKTKPKTGKLLLVVIVLASLGVGGYLGYQQLMSHKAKKRAFDELAAKVEGLAEHVPYDGERDEYEGMLGETVQLVEEVDAFRDSFGPQEGLPSLRARLVERQSEVESRIADLNRKIRSRNTEKYEDALKAWEAGEHTRALTLADEVIRSDENDASTLNGARELKKQVEVYRTEAEDLRQQAEDAKSREDYKQTYALRRRIREEYRHSPVAASVVYPLVVDSVPPGAEVTLDNEVQGKTPIVVFYDPAAPGMISLRRDGYEAIEALEIGSIPDLDLEEALHRVVLAKKFQWSMRVGYRVDADLISAGDSVFITTGRSLITSFRPGPEKMKPDWTTEERRLEGVISRPVIGGGVLYVGTDQGTLLALHANSGGEKWAPVRFQGFPKKISAPLVLSDDGKTLLVGSGTTLYAMDAEKGTEVWRQDLGEDITLPPTIAGDAVLVPVRGSKLVRRFYITDGKSIPGGPVELDEPPVSPLHDLGPFLAYADRSGRIHGVDPMFGTPPIAHSAWQSAALGKVSGTTPVGQNLWVALESGKVGKVLLIDGQNGGTVWRKPLETTGYAESALVDEDRIYFGTFEGHAYSVSAETGEAIWEHRLGARILAAPAKAAGMIVFATRGDESEDQVYVFLP